MASFNCGFARSAANTCLTDDRNQPLSTKARYAKYLQYFGDSYMEFFQINPKSFPEMVKRLKNITGKWVGEEKKDYFAHFTRTRWNELREIEKQDHSATNCNACRTHHSSMQITFPSAKSNTKKQLARSVQNPIQKSPDNQRTPLSDVTNRVQSDKITAHRLFQAAEDVFHKETGKDFRQTLLSVKQLKLQEKTLPQEKQKEKIKLQRDSVRDIKEKWASKDTDAFYSGRMSFK